MQLSFLRFKQLFLLLVIFSFSANSMQTELDYTGSQLIMTKGYRLFDSKEDAIKEGKQEAYTVTELCEDLNNEAYNLKRVKKWNLKGNYIKDEGAKKIAKFATEMTELKELNLSSNKISEDAIVNFIPLLLKEQFKYLNLARNKGAGSIDAIKKLAVKLSEKIESEDKDESALIDALKKLKLSEKFGDNNEDILTSKVNEYLSKVIWIPTNQINTPTITESIPKIFIKAHKRYYKMKL